MKQLPDEHRNWYCPSVTPKCQKHIGNYRGIEKNMEGVGNEGKVQFPYQVGDYVTIVVRYWTTKEDEDDIYYHGYITEFDEEKEGFWSRFDDNPIVEELFYFGDIEAEFDGDIGDKRYQVLYQPFFG